MREPARVGDRVPDRGGESRSDRAADSGRDRVPESLEREGEAEERGDRLALGDGTQRHDHERHSADACEASTEPRSREARLTNLDISALAHLGHRIRPDWGKAGIAAALHKVSHRSVADAVAALLAVCANARLRTPAVLADEYGSHWPDDQLWAVDVSPGDECDLHQQPVARCSGCTADRLAGTPPTRVGAPATSESRQRHLAEIKAAIRASRHNARADGQAGGSTHPSGV